jgi:hypothetical protein
MQVAYFDCIYRFRNHPYTVLTRYRPKPKIRKEHNLLSANDGTVEEEEDIVRETFSPARPPPYLRNLKTPGVITPYWHPVSRLLHIYHAFLIPMPEPYSRLDIGLAHNQPPTNVSRNCAPYVPSRYFYTYSTISDIMITGERDETGRNTFYMPIVYPNDFWHLRTYAVLHAYTLVVLI